MSLGTEDRWWEDLALILIYDKNKLSRLWNKNIDIKATIELYSSSFVVPPDIIPGRMALLVTLFLVLVNIFNTVTTNTPKAEGLTAIEAWMLSCILFVFGALVG